MVRTPSPGPLPAEAEVEAREGLEPWLHPHPWDPRWREELSYARPLTGTSWAMGADEVEGSRAQPGGFRSSHPAKCHRAPVVPGPVLGAGAGLGTDMHELKGLSIREEAGIQNTIAHCPLRACGWPGTSPALYIYGLDIGTLEVGGDI